MVLLIKVQSAVNMYTKVYVVLLLDDQENNFSVVVRTNSIPTSAFFWKLTLCRCIRVITNIHKSPEGRAHLHRGGSLKLTPDSFHRSIYFFIITTGSTSIHG
jgi:hypothetical protein